jgi:hypothetical protein
MQYIRLEGVKETMNYYENLAKEQLPFALSKGINDLAFMIKEKESETMQRVFDRPKPQTVRNVRVFKGNKTNPGATIAFYQIFDGDEYMIPEIQGGARGKKPSEKKFGRYFVPGDGAKLDAYGNMKGSQITQIMSQLGKFSEVGHLMNQTARSKGRRRGAAKTTEYFLLPKNHGGLAPGVYQRVQRSAGGFGGKTSRSLPVGSYQKGKTVGKYSSAIRSRGVIPVMLFVNKPTYKPRFPFYEVGQRVIDSNYHSAMLAAIQYALSTARASSG